MKMQILTIILIQILVQMTITNLSICQTLVALMNALRAPKHSGNTVKRNASAAELPDSSLSAVSGALPNAPPKGKAKVVAVVTVKVPSSSPMIATLTSQVRVKDTVKVVLAEGSEGTSKVRRTRMGKMVNPCCAISVVVMNI
jgi:hypothetical protein